jgi:hypothetical protein
MSQPPNASTLTSRRALLAGAAGALAGLAAQAIGRPLAARAAAGDPLALEQDNPTADTTTVTLSGSGSALRGVNTAQGGTGVRGISDHVFGGTGVLGRAVTGVGVFGSVEEGEASAVFGNASSPTGETYGVGGQVASPAGIGVMAWHIGNGLAIGAHTGDTDVTLETPPRTAVLAVASQDHAGARGVVGRTIRGQGVRGESGDPRGYGVFAKGRLGTDRLLELKRVSTPDRPPSGRAYIFVRAGGAGTQLCVRFPSGVVRVIATG